MTSYLSRFLLSLVLLLPFWAAAQDAETTLTEEEQIAAYQAWMEETLSNLKPQTGEITLPNGVATLNVPESFYYLSPEDSKTVLEDIWGNPPSELTQGMLFPQGVTPFDETSWGVTIEYVEEGYVDDSDAADIDYNDLLKSMQKDTAESNEWRESEGYPTIALVGWAKPPYYDSNTQKLYWAKELQFNDNPEHTLNYNIRLLGRKGYLLMNFIASMEQLPEIENNLDTILAMSTFNEGNRYADFNPDIDEVAAYGLGALVAGKVIAKTGFLAAAILLLKKFGVFILIGIGIAFKWFVGLFARKTQQ